MEESPQDRPKSRTNPLLLVLVAVFIAGGIGWSMYLVQIRRPSEANRDLNSKLIYDLVGLSGAAPLVLDPRFKDADGDWVADLPSDPTEFIDPSPLIFSFVGTDKPELYRERFKEFVDYLSSKTGRPVEYAIYRNAEEGMRALRDGKLHIAGLNTGNVPLAVNQCGFIPVFNLASDQGVSSYQMQVIVPADSLIKDLDALKGHEVTLTEPGSNSGFKAPLVLLLDHQLRPGRDFSIRYSGGHDDSIAGIASKTYQAAAIASDILTRLEAQTPPVISKNQYRVIYTSEDFPTAGFGYVYNLKPELAGKVRDAFVTFEWKGTGIEREFAAAKQAKFAPVSFKKDFALVRRIDSAIRSVSGEVAAPHLDALTGGAATQPTTEPEAETDAPTEPASAPASP